MKIIAEQVNSSRDNNMKTAFVPMLAVIVASIFAESAAAAGDADRDTIKQILDEIEFVPSLYAKGEALPSADMMPKYAALKLAGYPIQNNTPQKERGVWIQDKEGYARQQPIRAAVFEAAAETASLKNLSIITTLTKTHLAPKEKAGFLKKQ